MRKLGIPLLADVVAVVVFCVIGRASHTEAASLTGLLSTAWPFLTGLAVGWAIALASKAQPAQLVPGGVTIWFATLCVGMILRVVSGQGTAVSFIVVAAIALGIFLLGWRGIRHIVTSRGAQYSDDPRR